MSVDRSYGTPFLQQSIQNMFLQQSCYLLRWKPALHGPPFLALHVPDTTCSWKSDLINDEIIVENTLLGETKRSEVLVHPSMLAFFEAFS